MTSLGAKFCIFFSLSLCLCRVLGKHEWVDIYKRCCAGKTCGGWCFPMSACRRGGWVENPFS